MTVQSRTTLKSYFISGATPTEANFSDLIDSTLLVEDLVTTLNSASTTDPLSANLGAVLSESIDALDARVTTLEGAENDFVSNYYTKTEVDNIFAGVDGIIAALPFSGQISDINDELAVINTALSSKSDSVHTHEVSEVNGLQALLDAKASLVELNAVKDDLIASITAIDGGGGSVDLSGINASIDALNAQVADIESELPDLAHVNHVHDDIYSKTEVDTLIDSIDTFRDHIHDHTDITGLGGEIEAKTTLLVQDHAILQNNPHNVTKEQVGLGNVENLTPSEILEGANIVTQDKIDLVENQLNDHKLADNPHSITKETIGLGDVVNLNIQELLDAHLATDNPHNIDLSYFDVYSTAEADSRMQFYIESSRYAFTPLSNNDSAGIVGDFGYDPNNLYFKNTLEWKKIPFVPVYIEREATQADVDAGLATVVGEFIWVNELQLPDLSQITTSSTFNITNSEGLSVFEITEEGDLSLYNTTIDNVTVEGHTIVNRTLASSTEILELQDNTLIDGTLNVTGDTVFNQNITSSTDKIVIQSNTEIEGDTSITGGVTLGENISSTTELLNLNDNVTVGGSTTVNGEFNVKNELGDTIFNVTQQGNLALSVNAEIGGNLDVSGEVNTTDVNTKDITITNTANEVLMEIQPDGDIFLKSVQIDNGTANFSTLTSQSSNLRYIDTQEIEIWNIAKYDGSGNAQKNIKLTPSFGYTDGSEVVPDRLVITGNATNQVAYISDLPDLSGYALRSELESGSGGSIGGGGEEAGGSLTDLVIGGYSGEDTGYAYDASGHYAINYGADGIYGTEDDGSEEYWALIGTPAQVNTGILVDYGNASTNPFFRYNVTLNKWQIFDGTNLLNTDQAVELIYPNGTFDVPYIRYDELAGQWYAYNGQTVEPIGASTTIINEGDNVTQQTILNQTIVQESLTVDGTAGGVENGYAYTEYDDGNGNYEFVRYSIDYGADGVYGTDDDDDSEDYFEIDQSAYNNAGLTVNAGLSENPRIVYDLTNTMWLVENGEQGATNYGSFHLKSVDDAVANLVDSAPETLDTLNELAAALGDDPNFATTTATSLGNRYTKAESDTLLKIQRSQAYSWSDSDAHSTNRIWGSGAIVKSGTNYYEAKQAVPLKDASDDPIPVTNTTYWLAL